MKVSPQHQQGLTFLSLIFVLGLIGFFILLVLKIGPIYLDHSKVENALAALEKSTDIATRSVPEVRQSLDKRFNISYVTAVTQEDVKITKSDNYLKVEIEYEVVKKIVGNLSVLVEFYDFIEVGQK
jgi:flagellar biogenesis protein FliO